MPLPRPSSFAAACALACALLSPASAAIYSVGPGGDYPTLTAALQDGHAGNWIGRVVLELVPSYASTAETFPISLYGTNDVTIRPQAGATNLSISSAAGGVLYVGFGSRFVIDGRPGGVGTAIELTLVSTSTSAPTVTFADNAHDTLRWVNVRGANTAPGSGVILLSPQQLNCTDVSIEHSRIGGGGATPANLVYFTSSIGSRYISNVRIDDCELFDWSQSTQNSAAIVLQPGVRDVAIRRNSFYQTSPRTITTAARSQYALLGNGAIPSLVIEDNWFGGSAPLCGGSPWTLTGVGGFTLLYLNADNTSPARYQGNVFRNFDVTVAAGARVLSSFGRARIEGNVVGGTLPTDQLVFHTSTATTVLLSVASADSSIVRDNRIEGVTLASTSGSLTCLSVTTGAVPVPVANNVIGGSPAGAIATSSSGQFVGLALGGFAVGCRVDSNEVSHLTRTAASLALPMYGVRVTGASASLTGNRVSYLSDAAATTGAGGTPTLAGVSVQYSGAAWLRLSRNVVHSLASTAATGGTLICGVSVDMGTDPDAALDANFVHSLTSASADTSSCVTGIRIASAASPGAVTASNNMVRVGIGPAGENAVQGARCIGLDSRGPVTWVGNSVYVGSVPVLTGSLRSSAMSVSTDAFGPVLRNNILANERGGTQSYARHSALSVESLPLPGFSSDANLLWLLPRATGVVVVLAGGTVLPTLSAWQAYGFDTNSLQWFPEFRNALGGAANVDLHIDALTDLMPAAANAGVVWLGWTTDFDGEPRHASHPDIGADEFPDFPGLGVESRAGHVALAPARPNPSRAGCTFEFQFARGGAARLELFDAGGRSVRLLVNGTLAAGLHSVRWDRVCDDGRRAPPGAYFVRLSGPLGRESRRVIVLD